MDMTERISSRKNGYIGHLRRLGSDAGYRSETGETALDGEKLLREALSSGCELTGVLMDERRPLEYHRMLLNGELPLTIGGGIGQSRLCMLLLGKAHIGEVQSSIWDADTRRCCREAGVTLL